ncbi:protein RALF-like 22 [Ananas comosus]|uniref:Protein RALF-like 22 n=1 Tax=Ananas comosus TaxID=4615 RepID=A0A199UXW4_ANACO|nr:protein RALF-like 22 [Ananas comosus]OAY69619.1 Protein RALF-like 31 [Ananas comosus]
MKESPSILTPVKKRMLSWALLLVCCLLLTPSSPWKCSTSAAEVVLEVKLGCGGKLGGECLWGKPAAEAEMEMGTEAEAEAEAARRALWGGTGQKRYISYEALREDVVPCSRAGVPYYNCRALPSANLYARGCEIITGCARDANP